MKAPLWFSSSIPRQLCVPRCRPWCGIGHANVDEVWGRVSPDGRSRRYSGFVRWRAGCLRTMAPAVSDLDWVGQSVHLADRMPVNFAASRTGRELALIMRWPALSRDDPIYAYLRCARIDERRPARSRLSAGADRPAGGGQAAARGARVVFRLAAGDTPLVEEQVAWRRAAGPARRRLACRQDVDRGCHAGAAQRALPEWTH